ncbi:MAG: hypothetical protein QM503_09980 [Bacteroidota bacterium]
MKSTSFKYSTVTILLLLISISVSSQSFTKEDTIRRSFALEENTEIEITNKYGDITIENWDKDSIRIEIVYKVTSNKKPKLDPIYDAINFDFKANKYYVNVKTVFEGRGSFWFDVSEIANNLFAAGTYTSIDYIIYVPANQHLNINLKYGSVYMTNHTGYFNLSISNGNLKAHSLSGETKLNIDYGDAVVKNFTEAFVKLRYGTLDAQYAKKLSLTGQSSEFDLGIVDELIIDSKRDRVSIEEVNTISGTTYFTKLTIGEITGKLELSTKYGSFKLQTISKNVSNVQISTYNTSVNLFFQKGNNYRISLTSDNKAEVAYSAKLGEFEVSELPNKLKSAVCIYGSENMSIPVNIDIKSGLLTLKVSE